MRVYMNFSIENIKDEVEIPHPLGIKNTKQKSLLADMFEKLWEL